MTIIVGTDYSGQVTGAERGQSDMPGMSSLTIVQTIVSKRKRETEGPER